MPISNYLRDLRSKIGHDLLILPSVTGILFDKDDRILLMRHGDTRNWVAPGGSIEPGETPADATVREMWEETGFEVTLKGILGVFGGPEFLVEYSNGDQCTYVMTLFECEVIGGEMIPNDPETLELRYFSKKELREVDLSPWARKVLPIIFDGRNRPTFDASRWKP